MSYINNLNTHNGRIGKLGEDYASEYLLGLGHKIIERNFRTKYGEIDIVTEYKGKLHIIEVKTSASKNIHAVENMNPNKLRKVAFLASIYAGIRLYSIDFLGVSLNPDLSIKKIDFLECLEI